MKVKNVYSYPFDLISNFVIEENRIDTNNQKYTIETVDARSLLTWNRFDLMAKWIYIDSKDKGIDNQCALSVYKDNINAFSCGTFVEPGEECKNTFGKYLETFDSIIADVKKGGFRKDISLIPVDDFGEIFDGAHRVATAAYYNQPITILRLFGKKVVYDYDYKYFRKYLMSDINMGYMAIQYAHLKCNCYIACFWPVADKKLLPRAEEILKEVGTIVYEQDVYLTYRGIRNLMIQAYGHQEWTGSIDDNYSGVDYKATLCYSNETVTKTYLFEAESLEKVIEIKGRIRKLFGIENHSLHISDNKEETDRMVDLLYNINSVDYLNNADPYLYSTVWKKIEIFKNLVEKNNLDINRFIIDSSAVLEVCGLRRARDLDFLTDYCDRETTETQRFWEDSDEFEKHDSQLKYHSVELGDMLYNPENHFCYGGVKFLSLKLLRGMKSRRREEKDIKDIRLCDKFLRKSRHVPAQYRHETYNKIHSYQLKKGDYGKGPISYREYIKAVVSDVISYVPSRISALLSDLDIRNNAEKENYYSAK